MESRMPTSVSKPPRSSHGSSTHALDGPYVLHSELRSSQQQIAALVRRLGREPVLDVGAAQGFLGQLLQTAGLIVDAVEPHPVWATNARPFYRQVLQSGIEDAALPSGCYQVIVCADVLEHTVDPAAVLARLQAAATPDAVFVVSLPNVAHLIGRVLLLAGRFPRMERGIFDRTHLHFYTRDTARELIESAGLRIIDCQATPVPLGLIWRSTRARPIVRGLMAAQQVALRLAPRLFAYQWIIVARR